MCLCLYVVQKIKKLIPKGWGILRVIVQMEEEDLFFGTVWDTVSKRNVSKQSERGKEILAMRNKKNEEENKRATDEQKRHILVRKERQTGKYSKLILLIDDLEYQEIDNYFQNNSFLDFVSYVLENEKKYGLFDTEEGHDMLERGVYDWLISYGYSEKLQAFIDLIGETKAREIINRNLSETYATICESQSAEDGFKLIKILKGYQNSDYNTDYNTD